MSDIPGEFEAPAQQYLDAACERPAAWVQEKIVHLEDGVKRKFRYPCKPHDKGAIPLFKKANVGILISSDGKFLCTPEHATEVAYLMNIAEAAIQRSPTDCFAVAQILGRYLLGEMTLSEAMAGIND